ncbi:MAG TPA: hypothetical protein VEZ14_02595 [Dehalococcoidia bacterium]|nr:hypothetical protein [Dehalococcoidia bacterium]
MTDRLITYAASLLIDWHGGRTGRSYALVPVEPASPSSVVVAESPEGRLAVAVALLWEPESDATADEARQLMEERLDAGSVRGPYLLWAPPRAAVPSGEPEASDFVQRVQQVAAPMLPGGRGEVELPVKLQLAKLRDEGGYASVIGGLSRWWTLITERVNGTFHVNSVTMRRAPESSDSRERLFDRIGELSRALNEGDAVELDAAEAWTLQRLSTEPLGQRGFAIAQAPPRIDPADGSLMRRLVRRRLKEAAAALAPVEADTKGVALVAIYDYAEHENVGSFVKSLDPGLFANVPLLAAIVDGEVRPIFQPRS